MDNSADPFMYEGYEEEFSPVVSIELEAMELKEPFFKTPFRAWGPGLAAYLIPLLSFSNESWKNPLNY